MSDVRWESGIDIAPVYTAEDVRPEGIGAPGEYPFTRGIHPEMYRRRPWTMRQYSGFGTAAETRERFGYLLEHGQTGLNVAFDLPTQCGLDTDDPMAEGEVGRVGMAVDTLADMEEAFAGIDLDEITVSLTINGSAVPIMAMYFAMARKRGFDLRTLRGTAQNDILKEFVGRGTWIFPVEASVRLVTDTIEFCAREVPKYSPVSVCGYHIRESGATPAQEMAYGLAIARAYVDSAIGRGLDVDDFAGRLSFNFDVFGNVWEQVAKFRAGRRRWARILKEDYGAKDPRTMRLRMIAGGGGGGLTVEEPENNIVRGAYYALASALSGTQTMALCSYDEAYTIPSARAARLSLRTMQILMLEAGLCDTVDPLAGSYFVEAQTARLEKEAEQYFQEIERRGGVVPSVEAGYIQREIHHSALTYQLAVEGGTKKVVGVNTYVEDLDADPEIEILKIGPEVEKEQHERLAELRKKRDDGAVRRELDAVREACRDGSNLLERFVAAAHVYCTLGEIAAVLREEFGEYVEPRIF